MLQLAMVFGKKSGSGSLAPEGNRDRKRQRSDEGQHTHSPASIAKAQKRPQKSKVLTATACAGCDYLLQRIATAAVSRMTSARGLPPCASDTEHEGVAAV